MSDVPDSDDIAVDDDPLSILQNRFGLPDFRDGQRAVINSLLAGRNAAAVFPTGGGKSLCYQLPSQLLAGTTVVVSPLIALMKDQCDALAARGIPAARLDSSLSADELRTAMSNIRSGKAKMLYVSPERFFNERFLASIGNLNVSLFAIDEAHCISQWGHNFRPDYLKLGVLAKRLNAERILALTATATPQVLDDICQAFDIQPDDAIRTPFFRSNLQLLSQVVPREDQYASLLDRIRERPRGATLVYVSRQRTAEEISAQLCEDGFEAFAYHAGLPTEERAEIQRDFLEAPDQIVVATIAFGMGIDKSDIRYVYHFNPPKSLEAYAQEIGRAGRDGSDSICEILLAPQDRIVLENFAFGDTPTRESLQMLVALLRGQPEIFFISLYRLSYETNIRLHVLRTLLTYFELDGLIRSTSPRYDSYKIKPIVTSKSILGHYDGDRRAFVAEVLSCLTKGRTWFTLNMVVAAKRLDVEREQIVQVVEELAENGWIEIKVSDLVHGYERLQELEDPATLASALYDRLAQKEEAEVARLDDVFQLARAEKCQANQLSEHFGESRSEPCGTCTACLGRGPFEISPPQARRLGTSVMDLLNRLIAEYPEQLESTRDQARFLCGLSTPWFVRKRLTRDPNFGVCQEIPFRMVMKEIEDI